MTETYNEASDFENHRQNFDRMRAGIGSALPPRSGRVLDVGGGQGMHACFLASIYSECWCSDIIDYQQLYDGSFPRLFREKCARNSIEMAPESLKFIECDAMNILFRDGYFDLVTSFNAFEHIPDPSIALAEMIRVAAPDAVIYVSFDPIWTADTGSHFQHRVKEPWSHLIMSDEEFLAAMDKAGAPDYEKAEYIRAMNRKRLTEFKDIFADVIAKGQVEAISELSWSGVTNEAHLKHPNYLKCREAGFSDADLTTRGLEYVLRKKA